MRRRERHGALWIVDNERGDGLWKQSEVTLAQEAGGRPALRQRFAIARIVIEAEIARSAPVERRDADNES